MRRRQRLGFWYRFVICVAKPLIVLLTNRDWRGRENVPAEGGIIVAANHISYIDPFFIGDYLYTLARAPRFLAKAELFRVPVVKWVLKGAKQIPVRRNTADASQSLSAAVEALQRGECVLIYPEGSATRDPDLWPMKARTGVARLALLSGAPVIPLAQWGAHEILPYPTKRPRFFPRRTIRVLAGPPVDLSAFHDRPLTAETLRAATDTVMHRIAGHLVELRGGVAPEQFYDSRHVQRRESA